MSETGSTSGEALSGDEPGARLYTLLAELAVADEELLAQQREIDELVVRWTSARSTLRDLVQSVPLAVLTSDTAGIIVEANPSTAALLNVPLGRLARKPVQAFVASKDRSLVRDLVTRANAGQVSAAFALLPRGGDPIDVDAIITHAPDRSTTAELTWVLARSANPSEASTGGFTQAELRAVAALTTLPVGELSQHQLLASIASLTTEAIPGAWCASVTIGDPADPQDSAADSDQAQAMDGAQWSAGEGPGVTAYRTCTVVITEDVSADPRWPQLARLPAASSVRSVLAMPLEIAGEAFGALNVYGSGTADFEAERDVDRATVFCDAAAAVLRGMRVVTELQRTAENLKVAMASRAPIEQAKGIVASWLACSVDDAFAALTSLSQDRNVKLRDLALLVASDPSDRDLRAVIAQARRRAVERRQP